MGMNVHRGGRGGVKAGLETCEGSDGPLVGGREKKRREEKEV